MEERPSAFQTLKPVCIKLSKCALALAGGRSSTAEVATAQADVFSVLTSISALQPTALTPQLADYVFFPLSHVLRQCSKLPLRALEDSLGCTHILLKTAWRTQLEPKLGVQLFILLTGLADLNSESNKTVTKTTEELQITILQCFAGTFQALGQTKAGREALLGASTLPHLGKAMYEILADLKDGSSPAIQLAALDAVRSFISAVDDDVALGTSFFPGLVSSIQKVLIPSSTSPRTVRLLTGALDTLSELMARTLGDTKTRNLPEVSSEKAGEGARNDKLDRKWLVATASQVRTVLATVVKLRSHGRLEVRTALLKMCLALLSQCRESLSEAASFLLETAIVLLNGDDDRSTVAELQTMLTLDESLADLLRTSLHGWLVSLPRIMQSNDDLARSQLMLQIARSFKLLSDGGLDISIIDRLMADQLRDGIASSIRPSIPGKINAAALLDTSTSGEITIISRSSTVNFNSVFAEDRSLSTVMAEMINLLQILAASPSGIMLAQQLLLSTESLEGSEQLAGFWSALQILRLTIDQNADSSEFLAFRLVSEDQLDDMIEQLYSLSLQYIDPSVFEEERDWRIQALALETIALYAQRHKEDFRGELVESLYPIVHLIGTDNATLRLHAMTCLNIVATATGHNDAKELIIANVDYLVNAVALKLNTFDISAQAPQVLMMMVRLTGPRLLPYLDDLVDSMFAALDAYHGYPKLVETIFTVLLGIAQEGAKNDQLAITLGNPTVHKPSFEQSSVTDVADTLRRLKRKRHQDLQEAPHGTSSQGHPKRPWSESVNDAKESPRDSLDNYSTLDHKAQPTPVSGDHESETSKPPVPKTYAILLKISELTQHYLTASSPSLRTSLLALLHATFPALSKHENSFLPLINTLWPTIVSRLEDEEAYVVTNALETISVLCTYAGDFMRGRIASLWPELKKLTKTRARLGVTRQYAPSLISTTGTGRAGGTTDSAIARTDGTVTSGKRRSTYVDAPTRLLQGALFNVFQAIVAHAGIDADIFDDILDLVGAHLLDRAEDLTALEHFNSGSVWLQSKRLQESAGTISAATDVKAITESSWSFPEVN